MNRKRILSDDELSALFGEFRLLVGAGLPVGESADVINEDERSPAVKKTLAEISEKCSLGAPFYEALKQCGAFPDYCCNMARVGENTGRLEECLASLSEWYGRRARMKKAVRSAVAYPLLLTAILLAVVLLLVTKVLPVFAQMSEQLGAQQSPLASVFLGAGAMITKHPLITAIAFLFAVSIIVVIILYVCRKYGSKKLIASRFSAAMAMGTASGLPTEEALDLASALVEDAAAAEKIALVKGKIESGETFSSALEGKELLDAASVRMLSIARRTGKEDAVLADIAARCEDAYNEELTAAVDRIEPTLVVIMSVLVGCILLSVMLPLLGVLTVL